VRILMLAQFYKPIIGGEERMVEDLSIELAHRGHDVAVATLWHRGLPSFEVDKGVRIYRIHSTTQRLSWLYKETERNAIPPFPDPEAMYAIRNLIIREKPQIVHAHNWLVHSFLPLKKWSGASLVMTLHDYSLSCAKKRLMYHGKPCSGPAFSKCLTCSVAHYGAAKGVVVTVGNMWMSKAERRLVDLFVPISRAVSHGNNLDDNHFEVQVIPNFIRDDLSDRQESNDPCLALLPDNGYLLFVGDLVEDKGINVLLQAYRELKNAPPLVLIGRKFPNLPLDLPRNVHMLGMWKHPSVLEAWRRCSIALTPSIWAEPFGLVAIEAMAVGRPVIASGIGGLRDFILDGQTGYLVPPGDPIALQHAIESLLANPQLRERMGQAAKQKSIEFQASSVIPRIEHAYQALIDKGPS
jgi:glycosyltransferase involved in cell wall biosynthesis